jgi:2-polyprenyl-6-hydroxyphenyl methylase/3-demethylubiquinone-9 3-methyltransferase
MTAKGLQVNLCPLKERGFLTMAGNRGTVDEADVARFEALGEDWWAEKGSMRPLHRLNPVRIAYIRDHICQHFPEGDSARPRDPKKPLALAGLSLLDIGCGGGILAEPLARLGADVTGIDPAPGNIQIASSHAAETGTRVTYRAVTAEDLASEGARFDVVTAMEVVEHVTDVSAFVKTCAGLVKPNGLLFMATLNRTLKSFALAIVGAEYVLRWVPKGTHQWEKFVTPSELEEAMALGGADMFDMAGVVYNPLRDTWSQSRDVNVNYMCVARRG